MTIVDHACLSATVIGTSLFQYNAIWIEASGAML